MENPMKARIKYVEGVSFVAESGSGHAVVIDGAPEYGGRNMGMRPMEMLLAGAGACSAFDVVTILKKMRQPVRDVQVSLDAERAETDPKVFTKINLHYQIFGEGLDVAKAEQAVYLSKEKYCSATIMLGQVCEIAVQISVNPAA
jgi:putative redox protein